MTAISLILLIPLGFMIFLAADFFVRRSLNSFRHAERVWVDLSLTAKSLVEAEIPTSVRRVVLALMVSTGCGCYVRGMLVAHYLPRNLLGFWNRKTVASQSWDTAFYDASSLPSELGSDFRKFIALVMVYDSYRNPLQGYFFRRLIRSVTKPNLDFGTQAEAELTAFSVVSKRNTAKLVPSFA